MNKFRLIRGSTYSIEEFNCRPLLATNALIYGAYSQSGTPSIDSPKEIKFVGDPCNNLYKPVNITEDNYLTASTGAFTAKKGWYCSDYFAVEPSTTYTIVYPRAVSASTAGLSFYNSEKTVLGGGKTMTQQGANYTFTTASDCHYIRFSWKTNGSILYPKIALGSTTAIDDYYEGYKIPVTVNGKTKNIYLSAPLRQVDQYYDYIDLANQKVVRQIYEVDMKTKAWEAYTTVSKWQSYKFQTPPAIAQKILSNKFTYFQFSGTILGKECCSIGSSFSPIYFVINTNTHTYDQAIDGGYMYFPLRQPSKESISYSLDTEHIESISIGTSIKPSKIETVTVTSN